ncbi:hypothetical protein PTI98_013593 [Pleurotus ostreatus]|nr:hypothetical protein PTI98_013593 [Pleurotus ostreatus]
MARSGRNPIRPPLRKFPASTKKSNEAGFLKRKARKSQAPSEVYEYEPSKTRRAKVDSGFDRDELKSFGGAVSDGESDAGEPSRARLIGENEDNEAIGSDDDEEIDSDAAFEESDEDRFAGFKFASEQKPPKKKSGAARRAGKVRFAGVDLNEDDVEASAHEGTSEDEEDEEDGDPSDFIDILDVLDGKGEVDTGSDAGDEDRSAGPAGSHLATHRHSADESDSPDSASEEEARSMDDDAPGITISDDEDDTMDTTEALDNLQNFVTNLGGLESPKGIAKRKGDASQNPQPAKRRHIIKERTEAGAENEFGAHTNGAKLNLDDLLAPLAESSSTSALASLQKSVKTLRPPSPSTSKGKGKAGSDAASSKSKKPRTLAAPLPQRTQERLDREAAYEQTKTEVDKWSDSMKRIKDAEHLSFPLQPEPKTATSNLELAARFKPKTELESGISKLLQSAHLREEDIAETEDSALQAQQLTVEEVAARRAELRKMRELMYRAEVRAHRVKKIKSKTYRRLRRKEKEKLDGATGDDDMDEEEMRLRKEVDRARERATLRHKNTGKWAKSMSGKQGLGEDERRAIEEMLDRGEKLKRKIQGQDSDSEQDDESDEDEEDADEDTIKARAFEELARLRDDHSAPAGKARGVFEMKFMKDAMARDSAKADRERDDFIRELGGNAGLEDHSGDNDTTPVGDEDVTVQRLGGRVIYQPGALPVRTNSRIVPLSTASDTSSVTLKSTDLVTPSPIEARQTIPSRMEASTRQSNDDSSSSNPWLASRDEPRPHVTRKKNEVIVSKTSGAADKSKNRLKKQSKKLDEERTKARDDAEIEISMDNVLKPTEPRAEPASLIAPIISEDDDSDANSEVEEQEKMISAKQNGGKNGQIAFQQRDLVALAFAGDNVVQQFEEVKRREMAEDAPQEVDTTLPGWGSWGGTGARKQPPKPHLIKKVAGVDPGTRADYGKAHVIISEKRDKKAAKYLVKDLPYPYTSKAQFERSMETPLGTEWNTRLGFQKGTLPKIVKKMGTVINPLEKLF